MFNVRLLLRFLCIALPLCVLIATAGAQTLPVAAPAPAPTAAAAPPIAGSLTRADTARAVHELFKSRRGGGFGWLAFGGAGMAASIIPAQQSTSAGVWTPGVVIGSTLALLGTKKVIQFGWGRERSVLRDLAATGHLPADVRRRLRGNYTPLHGTASESNPLLAQGIAPTPAAPATLPGPVPTTPAATPAPIAPSMPTSAPAPTPVQLLTDAHTDTLDAVRGLFLGRRSAGTWPLIVMLPVARILTGSTATSPASPYAPQTAAPTDNSVALGLGLMGAGLAYMLIHNAPYTNARYEALLLAYNNGQPLPANIRQCLRPRHLEKGRQYRQRLERRALRHRK